MKKKHAPLPMWTQSPGTRVYEKEKKGRGSPPSLSLYERERGGGNRKTKSKKTPSLRLKGVGRGPTRPPPYLKGGGSGPALPPSLFLRERERGGALGVP